MLLRFCSLQLATPATAQKRVALVVGNGAYSHGQALANPPNDALDIQTILRPLGFEIIVGIDVDRAKFTSLLNQFASTIADGDETLFFYAGHGLQAKGVNHLIPVDAKVSSENDLEQSGLSLDLVLQHMKRASTKIVLLDACRDNPFAGLKAQASPDTQNLKTRTLSLNPGLAVSTATELGTFIAYATQPGNVAIDGAGRNSPFTATLRAHLDTTGQSISDLMMVVRNEVAAVTNGTQIPWEHSALARKFYFHPGSEVAVAVGGQKASEAAEAWSWIRNSSNPALLDEFIRRFGDTPFASQARTARAELKDRPGAISIAIPNLASMTLRHVQPSFDCKVHYGEAEVAICNNAELSILDNEISRLYGAGLQVLAAEQRRWIEARDACKSDIACLTRSHQQRVLGLARTARATTPPPAKAETSFDCAKHVLPAEVAVCADRSLARLDVELDRRYSALARQLASSRRNALGVEQRQWLITRDTCASDQRCLELQYRARVQQLQGWR